MPWLSIIVALLSFFTAKKSGASTGEALAIGAIAGGATYAVSHYTDWGVANLGVYDGMASSATTTGTPSGSTATGVSTGLNPTVASTLPVLAGAAGGLALGASNSTLLWVGVGLAALFLLKG